MILLRAARIGQVRASRVSLWKSKVDAPRGRGAQARSGQRPSQSFMAEIQQSDPAGSSGHKCDCRSIFPGSRHTNYDRLKRFGAGPLKTSELVHFARFGTATDDSIMRGLKAACKVYKDADGC